MNLPGRALKSDEIELVGTPDQIDAAMKKIAEVSEKCVCCCVVLDTINKFFKFSFLRLIDFGFRCQHHSVGEKTNPN